MGGGAIVTNDDNIARKARAIVSDFERKQSNILTLIQLLGYSSIRNRAIYNLVHKMVRGEGFRAGINLDNVKCRFSNMQASIGLLQLGMLDEFNEKRRNNATFLVKQLKKYDGINLPEISNHNQPIFLRFPIQVSNTIQRDQLMHLLEKNGIETSVVYPIPLSYLYNTTNKTCQKTEIVTKNVITLPTHPVMQRNEFEMMINTIKKFTDGVS